MRTVDLRIEDVAFGGKGVARDQGKAVFVPFTIDEEVVSTRIVQEKKQFAEAELIDVRDPSIHRVEPGCPYFGRCGGCSYQHIDYEHQLAIKWHQVKGILERIGKLRDVPMRPMVASTSSYGYRNRITVHATDGVIGFFRRDKHRVLDIERCVIALPEVNARLTALRARLPRDGHYTLRADGVLRGFSQTNDDISQRLLEHVKGLIPNPGTLLLDSYCGSGFFAKHLLNGFERVVGIDWDIHAIEAAKGNAGAKETYYAGSVDEVILGIIREADARSTTVVVDPPAIGLSANVRRMLVDFSPGNLIYVSCNPPTLARDLMELRKRFAIDSVTPFDMFPQTAEIEVVAHLRARSFLEAAEDRLLSEKEAIVTTEQGNG